VGAGVPVGKGLMDGKKGAVRGNVKNVGRAKEVDIKIVREEFLWGPTTSGRGGPKNPSLIKGSFERPQRELTGVKRKHFNTGTMGTGACMEGGRVT